MIPIRRGRRVHLLSAIEREAAKVGLIINRKKTEFLTVGDIEIPKDSLVVSDGPIKQVDDFKYLGTWLMCSRKDFEVRKAVAWKAATRMVKIWKSNLIWKIWSTRWPSGTNQNMSSSKRPVATSSFSLKNP